MTKCAAGEVIILRDFPVNDEDDYDCETNVTCPPGGGYRYGAFSDDSITTSTVRSTTMEGFTPDDCVEMDNPLGECSGCDPQVFVNDECTQGFECNGNGQ